MIRIIPSRNQLLKSAALLFVAALLCLSVMAVRRGTKGTAPGADRSQKEEKKNERGEERGKTLYSWPGDQPPPNPDFLAAVTSDESSPNYGNVIPKFPLPGPGPA